VLRFDLKLLSGKFAKFVGLLLVSVFAIAACGSESQEVAEPQDTAAEPTTVPASPAPSDSDPADTLAPSETAGTAEAVDPAETYALADVVFEYLVPLGSTPVEVAATLEDAENSATTPASVQGGLADFAGQPLVVNFWGSWCPPCVREMPEFESVHQAFKGEVAFLGMNVQDEVVDALNLARRTGVTYPLSKDPQADIQLDFAIISLPATLFISPEGEELDRWVGILNDSSLTGLIEDNFAAFLGSSS